MTKDNIMKMTDGLFHKVFDEIAQQYEGIATEHAIIDIGSARIAHTPERFDVIVTPNLYGDIISDIAAEISGSVGLAGSANIGAHVAMFKAIHGSAPDIAGRGVANPSGLLLGAVQMLVHIEQADVATLVHNAWLKTLEDGIHTADIASEKTRQKAGTHAFAEAVIERLGKAPSQLKAVTYQNPAANEPAKLLYERKPAARKEIVGVDVFVHARDITPDYLAGTLATLASDAFALQMLTNRGVKVWPGGFPETFCTDHWRCRFMGKTGAVQHADIIALLNSFAAKGVDFIKTENLCTFDGEAGYALGQGQ